MKDRFSHNYRWTGLMMALAPATVFASEGGGGSPSLFAGDLGNVFWTLVTFLAVVVILGKFAWTPILTGLRKREDFIRDSLEKAKQEREQAEQKLQEYQAQLDTAHREVAALLDKARRDADALRHRMDEEAKAEAKALMERAKREIHIATETAVQQLYHQTAVLSTQIASRLIKKEVSPDMHKELIRESIDEMIKARSN